MESPVCKLKRLICEGEIGALLRRELDDIKATLKRVMEELGIDRG